MKTDSRVVVPGDSSDSKVVCVVAQRKLYPNHERDGHLTLEGRLREAVGGKAEGEDVQKGSGFI